MNRKAVVVEEVRIGYLADLLSRYNIRMFSVLGLRYASLCHGKTIFRETWWCLGTHGKGSQRTTGKSLPKPRY